MEFSGRDRLANTYPDLAYEVTAVRRLAPPPAALQERNQRFVDALPPGLPPQERMARHVFHTCKPGVAALIEREGMLPSPCGICLGRAGLWIDHDNGWFGDHSQGVYVSKHADYTFFYQQDREVRVGDEGEVLVLELVTGRVLHFEARRDGAAPSADHDCHESPNHLEFFVYDENTRRRPPEPSYRLAPRWAIKWRAVKNTRKAVVHDA